jgi:hypothetical protein
MGKQLFYYGDAVSLPYGETGTVQSYSQETDSYSVKMTTSAGINDVGTVQTFKSDSVLLPVTDEITAKVWYSMVHALTGDSTPKYALDEIMNLLNNK